MTLLIDDSVGYRGGSTDVLGTIANVLSERQ